MWRSMIAAAALVASSAAAVAQDAPAQSAPYCADLKQLNNLAMTRERFAPVIGKPREGNYRDASLPLTGWKDCVFYGTQTYTCDSPELKTADDARKAQALIFNEILGCFAGTWTPMPEQSTSSYVVLHPKLGPASITLNLDQTDNNGHIVRLILFLRRP